MTFQRLKVIVTSSRRHFVKINLWSYLHNGKYFSFIFIMIKINIRPVNFRSINVRKCARTRSSARLRARKNLKCSKSSQFFLHTFQAIWSIWQKIALTRMRARFLRVLAFCNIESPNFLYHHIWHIFPSILITCSSFNNAMSVRQSWQRARTCVIFIHNTWAKTCLYKILCNSSE